MNRASKEKTHVPGSNFTTKLGATTYNVAIFFKRNNTVMLEDKTKQLLTQAVKETDATT